LLAQRFVRVGVIVNIHKGSRTASFAKIFEENAGLLVELLESCGGGFTE
jgi:hypothetical protein